jgi:hypothetical protein
VKREEIVQNEKNAVRFGKNAVKEIIANLSFSNVFVTWTY